MELNPLSLGQVDAPLKIRSRLLDTEIWLVPEDYGGPPLDAPAYTAAECRLLVALKLEAPQLRALHLVKEHLAGELVEAEEAAGWQAPHPHAPSPHPQAGKISQADF